MAENSDAFSEDLERNHMPSKWGVRLKGDDLINYYLSTSVKNSNAFKSDFKGHLNVVYGERPEEKMDIFGYDTVPQDAPVVIFFHGGYWIAGNKDMHSFVAKSFVLAGIAVVIAGYPLAPKVTLDDIVASGKRCAKKVVDMSLRKRSAGVFLSGHSAGAHIAAMILSDKAWMSESKGHVKGAVLFSGVYDTLPLLRTSVARDAGITIEQATRACPLLKFSDIPANVKVLIVVAEHDPPPFHEQAQVYKEKLFERNVHVEFLKYPGDDHFTFFESLMDRENEVTQRIVQFVLRGCQKI
ncbi:kynurenine formamidase-like [Ornithodoros turicata]|uniref:kynurenine formamidase-like n=1 Tax=Ornithodoros turicata TaxID=34597 RepID=UPI0031394CD6